MQQNYLYTDITYELYKQYYNCNDVGNKTKILFNIEKMAKIYTLLRKIIIFFNA